jgi:hypothetical protein
VISWHIQEHAVARLRERVAPHFTAQQAEEALGRGLQRSARMRERTSRGQARFLLQDPHCIAIVREEPERRVVVTVYPPPRGQWKPPREETVVLHPGDPFVPIGDPAWDQLREETRLSLNSFLLRLAAERTPGLAGFAIRLLTSPNVPC